LSSLWINYDLQAMNKPSLSALGTALLIASAIMTGCGRNEIKYSAPKFETEAEARFEVFSEELEFNAINDIYSYKSCLAVVAWNPAAGSWLHVYDKETGKFIADVIHEGRGPGETIMGALNTSFDRDKGIVRFCDLEQGRSAVCDLNKVMDSEAKESVSDEYLFSEGWAMRTIPLREGRTLYVCNMSPIAAVDTANSQRFIIRDSLDNILGRSDDYPFEENTLSRWNLYNATSLDVSPGMDKLVVGTCYGAILETFDVKGDTVDRRSVSYFLEPEMDDKGRIKVEENAIGFGDFTTTDDLVYVSYEGRRHSLGEDPQGYYQKVAVFDWDGRPKSLISCGVRVESLYADTDDGMLYAAVSDANGVRFLAKMPLPTPTD